MIKNFKKDIGLFGFYINSLIDNYNYTRGHKINLVYLVKIITKIKTTFNIYKNFLEFNNFGDDIINDINSLIEICNKIDREILDFSINKKNVEYFIEMKNLLDNIDKFLEKYDE